MAKWIIKVADEKMFIDTVKKDKFITLTNKSSKAKVFTDRSLEEVRSFLADEVRIQFSSRAEAVRVL